MSRNLGKERTDDDILTWITLPLGLNNPVAAIERLLRAELPREAKKRIANSLIRSVLSTDLTGPEKEMICSILSDTEDIFSRRKSLLQELDAKKATSPENKAQVGNALSLFVADNDAYPFGVVHPVIATSINDGKGEHKVIAPDFGGNVISLAGYVACEAIRFTLGRYGLIADGYSNLDNCGITIQVGRIDVFYDGASLGVAVSCAIMSSLLNCPIPCDTAFTGEVNIRGEIQEVGGLEQKLKIAALKGIKRVYIPMGNLKTVERKENRNMEIISLSTLKELFDDLFTEAKILSFVADLNSKRREVLAPLIPDKGEKDRLLISTVGMRDPYGRSYQKEDSMEFSEGPILTAFRRLSPATVLLLPTKETIENAEKTKQEIKKIAGVDVCLIKPLMMSDPTDYDAIYEAVDSAFKGLQDIMKDKEVYVSISSGTPQMHAVFIELLRSGKLKGHPIQVKEPKFATSWEDRVKPIRSRYLRVGDSNPIYGLGSFA